MLSYYLCIKTLSTETNRNVCFGSWNESRLRGPVNLENYRRVTVYTVRLTKLTLFAHLTLDSNSITGIGLFKTWFPTRMYWKPLITVSGHSNQLYYEEQRPKYIIGGNLGTMGNPKGRKSYGSGNPVRGLGFRCFSSISSISGKPCASLRELMDINKKNLDYKNDKLIHIVSDLEVLVLAYDTVKSKPGNTTPGIYSVTSDKIDLEWFKKISKEIKAGKFKFKLARRVCAPNQGKKAKGPLTSSSPRDKVVQQAIYFVLNSIYEPSFLDASHGSRPNKGTHSALKNIKYKFGDVKWCLEASIGSNFPNISHTTLRRILSERIVCSKFLALVKNSIKAGYVEDEKFHDLHLGLFQNSVISPILNNIYLNKFDIFMKELRESFSKDKQRRKAPSYRRTQYLMGKLDDPKKIKKLRNDLLKGKSKDSLDPNIKKLVYIRYVNDFVVGIIGSRSDTLVIQQKIGVFLKDVLGLTLSDQKTFITHFSKDPIFFLGTFIKGGWKKNKRVNAVERDGVQRKVRITSRVVLEAPIKNLFEKATQNSFFKKRAGEFVPTNVGRLINLDHSDILMYYNSVIRGVLDYYSFATNRKSLGSFVHGLKMSCARTLALKYKLRHASKAFSKFGSYLKCSSTGVALFIPKTFKAIKTFGGSVPLPDFVLFSNWNNKLTKSNLFLKRTVCGSHESVKMRHVRKIKDLKNKATDKKINFFTAQMASINRKQIPLCTIHYQALHNNNFSPQERKLFRDGLALLK